MVLYSAEVGNVRNQEHSLIKPAPLIPNNSKNATSKVQGVSKSFQGFQKSSVYRTKINRSDYDYVSTLVLLLVYSVPDQFIKVKTADWPRVEKSAFLNGLLLFPG